MAPNPEGGTGLDERRRVLIHASSLNRSDIIKKVVSSGVDAAPPASTASGSSRGGDGEVDREVLDHADEEGLTALHHAVKKSSLDVSWCGIATGGGQRCPIFSDLVRNCGGGGILRHEMFRSATLHSSLVGVWGSDFTEILL